MPSFASFRYDPLRVLKVIDQDDEQVDALYASFRYDPLRVLKTEGIERARIARKRKQIPCRAQKRLSIARGVFVSVSIPDETRFLEKRVLDAHIPDVGGLPKVIGKDQDKGMDTERHFIAPFAMCRAIG